MNTQGLEHGRWAWAFGLLAGVPGWASAYAMPPAMAPERGGAGAIPAEMATLLWLPLLVLTIALALGLVLALRRRPSRTKTQSRRTIVQETRTAPPMPAMPAKATAATPHPRHSGRRWRSIASVAH
ncbi:MAG: hypothetical protein ACPGJF_17720 [Sinimarinibacterium flocculans]|uniref:hypothetical protein n=1 Tax=Sinimarinibacterium flocculans TaxID=985250 RepID=UPI003C417927